MFTRSRLRSRTALRRNTFSTRLQFESLEDRRMMATLSSGNGAGSVDLRSGGDGVDGYGAFGSFAEGPATEDAILTLADNSTSVGTVFESALAIGIGSNRHYLSSGVIDSSSAALSDPTTTVNGSNTIATSNFDLPNLSVGLASLEDLQFDLHQEMIRLDGTEGSMLVQTYTITNATGAPVAFDIYRYIDGDIQVDRQNGGGRLVTAGVEVLFETTDLSTLSEESEYVAITAEGGTHPSISRFEVDAYQNLRFGIASGGDLDDEVLNDVDDDQVSDFEYDVTLAFRNSFSLGVNETATYVTRTIWGSGAEALEDSIAKALAPPKVTEVTISGDTSTHAAYNFSTADGSGDQLKTVPVGGANQIAIKFSEDVDIASDDLDLIALNKVVTEPSVTNFVAPTLANGFTATWTFNAAFPDAQFLIRLADSIEDLDGIALDGDWTNPDAIGSTGTSVFPSGDGVQGGDFEFVFTILRGDANRDLQVTINDYGALSSNYNQYGGKTWAQADFSGDGNVTINDYGGLSANWNANFSLLKILGDLDGGDYDVDDDDETDFLTLHGAQNAAADLDGNGLWNQADIDAFYEQYNFGIDLEVV
jgi:hypothetical protein